MQYLAQIISAMNASIRAILDDKRFAKSLYYGIAVIAEDNKALRPLITDDYDNDTFISVDDKVPLTVYHRTLQITRALDAKKRYGADAGQILETASMCLIAYGTRKLIKLTPEELEAAIAAGMPTIVAATTRKDLKLNSCQVQLTSSVLDPVQIYSQETKSEVFDLPPNQLLIRVNYNVISTYNTACFNLCDC